MKWLRGFALFFAYLLAAAGITCAFLLPQQLAQSRDRQVLETVVSIPSYDPPAGYAYKPTPTDRMILYSSILAEIKQQPWLLTESSYTVDETIAKAVPEQAMKEWLRWQNAGILPAIFDAQTAHASHLVYSIRHFYVTDPNQVQSALDIYTIDLYDALVGTELANMLWDADAKMLYSVYIPQIDALYLSYQGENTGDGYKTFHETYDASNIAARLAGLYNLGSITHLDEVDTAAPSYSSTSHVLDGKLCILVEYAAGSSLSITLAPADMEAIAPDRETDGYTIAEKSTNFSVDFP